MPVETITVDALLTTGGITAVVWILVTLIFKTAAFSEAAKDRFGAALAALLGVILAIAASIIVLGPGAVDLFNAALTGLIGGLAAVGVQELASGVRSPSE
jgi:multisubunit Na+/H+ antiporter MnhB subunit